jgi:hypothetical protein
MKVVKAIFLKRIALLTKIDFKPDKVWKRPKATLFVFSLYAGVASFNFPQDCN